VRDALFFPARRLATHLPTQCARDLDQRYLERVRAVSLALDTKIETSEQVLQALTFTSEVDSLPARPAMFRD
jgi:hypothetical protein